MKKHLLSVALAFAFALVVSVPITLFVCVVSFMTDGDYVYSAGIAFGWSGSLAFILGALLAVIENDNG